MNHWSEHAFFYHLYPLGVTGAPWANPGGTPVPRITQLIDWITPAQRIGANAVLFGPIWESGTHGYDTHDLSTLDRRLGTNADLATVVQAWRTAGFRVVLDGVFHHVGRGFGPFEDLRVHGPHSRYRDWFAGVDFARTSPYGDRFAYDGWNGHHSLVKFNLANPEVRAFLFDAVGRWIDEFDIDGLRLDAADVIDRGFLRELSAFCKAKKPDFWLMGEVIHGDYNQWSPGAGLDSVTNYELFKGLWSSHNDANYFEVAWTLNRQFGAGGLYRGQSFATFGDNHDVDRIGSVLAAPAHLYPHAILAGTVPGIPTIYYGSEVGLPGRKTPTGDEPLRPALAPSDLDDQPHQPLRELWGQLARIRRDEPSLRTGGYEQALVAHRQLAYWRTPAHPGGGRPVLVLVNAEETEASVGVTVPPGLPNGPWIDLLNASAPFEVSEGRLQVSVSPRWGRILAPI